MNTITTMMPMIRMDMTETDCRIHTMCRTLVELESLLTINENCLVLFLLNVKNSFMTGSLLFAVADVTV